MNPEDPFTPGREPLPDGGSNQIAARAEDEKQSLGADAPAHDTRTQQAKTATEQANTGNEQAKTGTEQAETRIQQATTATEQAQTRTLQVRIGGEQAETRAMQATARIQLAEARTQQAERRTQQAESLSQQAVRASELSYRRLFEAARDGILVLEVDTGRITDANPFLVELLGFSREEMIGKTVGDLSPFRDALTNRSMLERLQKHGYVRYEDLPLETRDGRHIAVEFVCNVYEAGEKYVIQCNIRDITARKHVEEENRRLHADLEQRVIERTAQLQAANQELEAFSYSVSHDLRAPLRHVVGFVELLQKDVAASLPEKNLRHLTTISRSAKRMGDLIDDLLSFSRIGRSEMTKTEVDLDQLVAETLSDLQVETKERNIVWNIHPLPPVWADRSLLRQVLFNLLCNAVKFTGGRAEARIEIGTAPGDAGETVVFVRDNGAGFDPRYIEKLFRVFQRLHSQTEFEGTGIGLANVQRIIQRHGGWVRADGVVDGGAVFYFSLPTAENRSHGQPKN